MPEPPPILPRNRLLSALPRHDYERLLPSLTKAQLPRGKIIYDAGEHIHTAYFPLNGMLSLLSTTEDGSTVEVGMVGNEGMAGIPLILQAGRTPFRIVVQCPVTALTIPARTLRAEFNRGGKFQSLLLRYTYTLVTQISQSAMCNRFHSVEERLCRWLLITRDRVKSDTFNLTQEFISQMLGAPRTGVTMTAGKLQRMGLIRYSRGRITLLDAEGLETTACECYRVITEEINHALAA